MTNQEEIIKGCKAYNAHYQRALYKLYSSSMMSVCIRYSSDRDEAQDILQESFIKIYDKIKLYKGEGSFEGWMKRIIINTAVDFIRKRKKHIFVQVESIIDTSTSEEEEEENSLMEETAGRYSYEELMAAINVLSDEFKIVFNLFVIEDYSHKEIAELLSIKEETSRSRLIRAKSKIREFLLKTKQNKTAYRPK